MIKSVMPILIWAGLVLAQDFINCQTLKALQERRAAFETETQTLLKNATIPDSTIRRFISVYESYFSQLYPVMEKELKSVDRAKHFKRVYGQITEERESVLIAIDRLCNRLQGRRSPRICVVARKYLEEKQFREDFKTKPAPNFEFTNQDGEKRELSDFRGRYVLLHFWSMHSVPCVEELKDLKAVQRLYGNRVHIISISKDPVEAEWDKETLLNFINEMQLNWTQITGENAVNIFTRYHVHNYPTLYLIDPDGRAVNPDFIMGKALRGKRLFKTLSEVIK